MGRNNFTKNDMLNYLKSWTEYNHPEVCKQLCTIKAENELQQFYKDNIYPLFIARMKDALISMAFREIAKAVTGNSKIGAFILCSCYIDYLAYYYSNEQDNNKRYKTFVNDFLKNYDKEKLYKDLRCKIVHNFSEGGSYLFISNDSSRHLNVEPKTNKTFINLEDFMKEILGASEKLIDLISKDENRIIHAVGRHKEAPLLRLIR